MNEDTTPEVTRYVVHRDDGAFTLHLLVEGMHCPSCVTLIESALRRQESVEEARLNLSTRRLAVTWRGDPETGQELARVVTKMGYRVAPFDPNTSETFEKREEKFLLRCLAVAGFASGNLMLFSIPMWVSDSVEMGMGTRSVFQWVQLLIAVPAILYAGQPFYRSAWKALASRRTNMDVPISVAVLLATAMSVFEVITHGHHAYLDSGVMLLFFLLIGRYLDARARGRARGAAHDLLQMMKGSATVLTPDGGQRTIPLSEIVEGMTLRVAAGEKIGADGEIAQGMSEVDTSLITGETLPRHVAPGDQVFAGTLNMAASLTVRVTGAGERSLIAEIVRLMENAEQAQARYVTLADRISRAYTPVVHLLAAATFAGWLMIGAPWQVALLVASTVLIITCPCALGLAVPVVQVLASGTLMRRGILIKSGSALERLATVTHVVFDKTGTLTVGWPELQNAVEIPPEALALAASLASHSKHPLSRAVCRAWTGPLSPVEVKEIPGQGLEAVVDGKRVQLGKRDEHTQNRATDEALELWLTVEDQAPLRFTFADHVRTDAAQVATALRRAGLGVTLLSGDRPEAVAAVARTVGIEDARAALSPVEKCRVLDTLKTSGAKVLMVGDGLNDAPALAAATVSMSPASAMDITQNAADIVFQGDRLLPVLGAWRTAVFAQRLVRQNFALALLYNVVAIPLAVVGYVTPLIAALAMSSSSLLVIANAMRLNLLKEPSA